MYSENQIKTIAGAVATEIVEDNAPHLYEIIFNVSDDYVSFLTTENFGNHTIENADGLTQADCDYLNNFKDKNLSRVANNGSMAFSSDTPQIMGIFINNAFVLKLNGAEFDFNVGSLTSGTSISDEVTLDITSKQLF